MCLQSGLRVYAKVVGGAARRVALQVPSLPDHAAALPDFGDLDTAAALRRSLRALNAGLPVMLLGETGTGKEVAARALHDHSGASAGPFVAINCGAIPRDLIEGELFGYADGAYTGARRGGARGRIEEANGGTLFLDEIGDMPLELQTRLLRVLENREVTRLGESRSRKLDFQLVSATHQDVAMQVQGNRFRSDLYFRLNGMQLCLPPLRRRNNLGALIDVLLAAEGISADRLSRECRDALLRHDWPGNTRELRTALRYANAMAEPDEMIDVGHVPGLTQAARGANDALVPGTAVLKELNNEAILRALELAGGNVSAAARALGISRATLHRWRNRRR
jgi:transcriptional regulator with PAS, ATPase and Fis domain